MFILFVLVIDIEKGLNVHWVLKLYLTKIMLITDFLSIFYV